MGAPRRASGCGRHPWPEADPSLLERDTFELVVQVNGKRARPLQVPAELPRTSSSRAPRRPTRVQAHLDGGEPRKTIVVPRKLVNLVAGTLR